MLFYSLMYWGNLAILILSGCIDFRSSFLFFLYLLLVVFPIGAAVFDLLFGNKIPLDRYFRDMVKLLIGILAIALTVYVCGLDFPWALVVASASLLVELFVHRKILKKSFSPDFSGGYPLQNYAVIITSLVFTFLAVPSFTVFQFHRDHVTVVPSWDANGYYALLNAILHHSGTFLHGFASTMVSNTISTPVSTVRFLVEFYEASFLEMHPMDVIGFHSVLFSESGILIFLVISFMGVFDNIEREESDNRQYVYVAGGFLALLVFTYPLVTPLLFSAISAWHGFYGMVYLMVWMKLVFFDRGDDSVTVNTRLFYLASFILLAAFVMHAVITMVFVCAYVALLAMRLFAKHKEMLLLRKGRAFISVFAVFAVVAALYMRIGFFHENINIKNVDYNIEEARRSYKFQRVHRFIDAYIVPSIPGSIKESSAVAPLKAAWIFLSYAEMAVFLFLIYYLVKESRRKMLVSLSLVGTFLIILLVRSPQTFTQNDRPGIIGGGYSCIMLALVVVMMVIDIAASGGGGFVSAIRRKKSVAAIVLSITVFFTYLTFSRPWSVINIPNALFSVMQFVKEKTAENSVVLADLEYQDGVAYFSGFALRSAVFERSGYERITEKRAKDFKHFYSDYRYDTAKDESLGEYAVTHVLVSEKKPVEIPAVRFHLVYSSGEWKLYEVVSQAH